ncbi:3-isopropylmalate dehydratase small subunit [Candidatus Parcubacteria bacterium]|nr:3-isopropylmalate dehydratase small subunit [Candidatus Parcubacteria bacterium]
MKAKIHFYKRDNINTDEIIPARYLNCDNEAELAKYAMEDIDKDFTQNVQQGDFIIAGKDFGCGSSREHAIWALRGAGVKGVIAKSFARIFYRNTINNGFLAIECAELDDNLKTGDEMEINLEQGFFTVNGKKYSFSPIPDFVKDIMEKGGLLNTI